MTNTDGYRYCDRCGILLTKDNNKCGYEICDKCNKKLERYMEEQKSPYTSDGYNGIAD